MSDMDVVFQALAVLAKQNRELSDRVAELEAARDDHHERLTAHGMLLTTPRRSEVVRHYAAQLAAIDSPPERIAPPKTRVVWTGREAA